ncbi:response regulator [Marinomonas epiphytica]
MSTRVLICDDSKIARKQLSKILPANWGIQLDFAQDGQEALDFIRENPVDVLFLDLNMPVKDGYQTLAELPELGPLPTVIVVSGDVQPKAVERVKELGAKAFLKKPASAEQLSDILNDLNLLDNSVSCPSSSSQNSINAAEEFSLSDGLQEVSNIAMGRAASVLAEMLNVFIKLPVPNVNLLEAGELQMALDYGVKGERCSAISQGFVGSGVSFEALLIFSDSSFTDMAKLLGVTESITPQVETELLMDVTSVLVGPFMSAIAQQLNIDFSQGHPTVLGQHERVADLINFQKASWKRTLTVEIVYEVENYQISCDLMLLFTEDSVPTLEHLLSFLVEDEE